MDIKNFNEAKILQEKITKISFALDCMPTDDECFYIQHALAVIDNKDYAKVIMNLIIDRLICIKNKSTIEFNKL